MLKIVEVKEELYNSDLVSNIYAINKLTSNMINATEFIVDINRDDYNYINIVLDKTRKNLEKVYNVIKFK